jgi:hypothetical protein
MREPSQYEAPSCETIGGDFWFPETIPGKKESSVEDTKLAVSICNRCPHRRECAEWGISKRILWYLGWSYFKRTPEDQRSTRHYIESGEGHCLIFPALGVVCLLKPHHYLMYGMG